MKEIRNNIIMSQSILNKLIEQAISSGFDTLRDITREPLEQEDLTTMSSAIMNITWELRQIKTMSSLIQTIEEGTLSIMGYDGEEGLDNLFEDAGFKVGE